WDDLRAFANVTYASGICLSSKLVHGIPGQHGKATSTLSWSAALAPEIGPVEHWTYPNGYTDPSLDWSHLEYGNDPTVGPFVGFNAEHLGEPVDARFCSHIVGDLQYQGRDGYLLAFQCRGDFTADGLTIIGTRDDWGPRSKTFTAKVPKKDLGPGWCDVVLALNRFLDSDGKPPARWQDLDKIEI